MENFAITLVFLLIGVGIKRLPAFPKATGVVLNLFVIYVSLPALVMLKIPDLSLGGQLLVPALMPWIMLVFSAALIIIMAGIFSWDRSTTGCLLLLVPLGNTSFLGIPMVRAFLGDQAVSYALLYDQLGSFLALATYGSLILGLYGAGEEKPTPGTVLKKIISFPPFIALLIGFLMRYFPLGEPVKDILESLAVTLVPLVMIAVGYQLSLRLERKVFAPLGIGLSVKLIAAPALALFLCDLAGLDGEAVRVAVFEAGMPPMVSAGALAIMANLSPSLTGALVGLGIIMSFATLPVLYQFLSLL